MLLQETQNVVKIKFSVQDTGQGIAPALQKKLFKPFTQADSSTTRKYGGTGLGLSICKSFVELMGGEIKFESELGKGSNFYFTLPFEIAKEQIIENKNIEQRPHTTKKVLVVEDNLINQEIAKIILEEEGLTVDLAENGQEGLDMTKANRYDAIFMDMQMPIMNGIECTQNIRKLGYNVPIIAITANAFGEDRERCLKCGMNDFLAKPIIIETLKTCLNRWL